MSYESYTVMKVKELNKLYAALEAEQAERKEYRRESDRYREALEFISDTDRFDLKIVQTYAKQALQQAGGAE